MSPIELSWTAKNRHRPPLPRWRKYSQINMRVNIWEPLIAESRPVGDQYKCILPNGKWVLLREGGEVVPNSNCFRFHPSSLILIPPNVFKTIKTNGMHNATIPLCHFDVWNVFWVAAKTYWLKRSDIARSVSNFQKCRLCSCSNINIYYTKRIIKHLFWSMRVLESWTSAQDVATNKFSTTSGSGGRVIWGG